jgi:hypothetical protein
VSPSEAGRCQEGDTKATGLVEKRRVFVKATGFRWGCVVESDMVEVATWDWWVKGKSRAKARRCKESAENGHEKSRRGTKRSSCVFSCLFVAA